MRFDELEDEQKADLWASLAMRQISGLGPTRIKRLADCFGSSYKAVLAVREWTSAGLGIRPVSADEFQRNGWREEARAEWALIQAWSRSCAPEARAGLLLYGDQDYPDCLKEIPDAPLFLFYLGDLTLLKNPSVAVVGARKCTAEGLAVTVNIVRGLTRAGVTAISGMAKGIDRVVHLAGLEGVGSSIAVLGSGIDVPYPHNNIDLYNQLARDGLVLSELMPGTIPVPRNFPVRNRIISGLAKAVLVVEAALRSGTLITARHAVEQNRDVFAVPGSTLSNTSEGCRDLIRRGAKPVFSAEDILLELSPILEPELAARFLEKRRAGLFTADGVNVDDPDPETGNTGGAATKATGGQAKGKPAAGSLQPVAPPSPSPHAFGESSNGPSKGNANTQLLSKLCGHGILPWTDEDKDDSHRSSDIEKTCLADQSNRVPRPELPELNPEETAVLVLLAAVDNCHLDDMALRLDLPVARLSGLLAMLEVKGCVRRMPGMYYAAV